MTYYQAALPFSNWTTCVSLVDMLQSQFCAKLSGETSSTGEVEYICAFKSGRHIWRIYSGEKIRKSSFTRCNAFTELERMMTLILKKLVPGWYESRKWSATFPRPSNFNPSFSLTKFKRSWPQLGLKNLKRAGHCMVRLYGNAIIDFLDFRRSSCCKRIWKAPFDDSEKCSRPRN